MPGRDPANRAPSASTNRWSQNALTAIVGMLAVACIAGFWRVAAPIWLHVPIDPNEGWNAYHAAAAMLGHGPYPEASSFMTNNYPPLSFYVVGALGRVLGDNIVAGRIVSLLSFLAISAGIAELVRKFAGGKIEAAFAALFFVSFLLLNSDYVGMDDPQLLGHALQICGLMALLPRKSSLSTDLICAALFVAGIFVKHNLIAMPLAAIVWLLFEDWRAAIKTAAIMLALGLAGLVACRLAFGFDILSRINSARSYSLPLFAANFRQWLIPAALPLAATLAIGTTRRRFALFSAIYALMGMGIGGVFMGGAGVDANVMFDTDIAIALGAGIAVSRTGSLPALRSAFARPVLALCLVLPLAIGTALAATPDWLERDFWLRPMADDAALAQTDIAYLRAHQGPALCEMLSLCYWAGKPPTVDVFNLSQQFLTGARSEISFVAMLNERQFAVIQFDAMSPFPFSQLVQSALQKNYRIDRENDDGVFLVPRWAGRDSNLRNNALHASMHGGIVRVAGLHGARSLQL
jgi:hypothetical protein